MRPCSCGVSESHTGSKTDRASAISLSSIAAPPKARISCLISAVLCSRRRMRPQGRPWLGRGRASRPVPRRRRSAEP